ncbi:MAG: hypothetical protein WCK18_12350 [Prolixibacteraceae bacterium]
MGNPWFQFKKFRVSQEKSALRVGTDGVLLGAWCGINGAKRILDVGTGTGVIALMLAQRTEILINNFEVYGGEGQIHVSTAEINPHSDSVIAHMNEPSADDIAARIEAVEICVEACEDATFNFRESPWNDRLNLHCEDFRKLPVSGKTSFDLIISNPPFFKNSLRSADHSSSVARHDVTLTFEQLVLGAKELLTPQGRLAVIVPAESFSDFRETARLAGFYLSRKTLLIPKTGKPPKRVLLEFSVVPCYPVEEELVILLNDQQYSAEFISLTREFYLNFE